MADKKISALTASTTPLAGTEVLPIVQSGATVKVSVANLTAGRAVSASSLTASTDNVIIGTTAKGVTTGSAIPLGLGVNNTVTAMTIDTAGNVGIGTTAPTVKLQVAGGIASVTTDGTYQLSLIGTSKGLRVLSDANNFKIEAVDSTLSASYQPLYLGGSIIQFAAGASEQMRLDASGNVGINETAPDYKLDVNGAIGFTPGASVTPVDNGDVVFELTNNTTLTVKAKGSDGVVRSGTIILV